MERTRRPVAAVIGGNQASTELLAAAEAIGRGLVDEGFRLVTGGRGGVMAAASRGAHASERYTEGTVVGLLPTLDSSDANRWVDIVVPTGLHHARNALVVGMADVVVAVGGSAGTLSEMALAWTQGKPVVALDLGEGWSARLAGEALDPRREDVVRRATTAGEAVLLAVACLEGHGRA
jgi:hypothetical protein